MRFPNAVNFAVAKLASIQTFATAVLQPEAKTPSKPEAFSRVLIDQAIRDSGWDLLNPQQIQFELHTANGRADYLLKDSVGRVLCVLEAKREDLDPYDAKEQARGYAENLKAPFIILSNGRENWFWNYERADQRDAYRIERLPSQDDLERVRLKNLQPPRPLESEVITPAYLSHLKNDLILRSYQIRAMDEIARLFDAKALRKFLLEMATGTGKTLLCAALIRRFLVSRNAERVLFIVDRIELAKQTMEDFAVILPEYKPVIFKTARRTGELLGASVVVATIQSLMTNRRYRQEFTPFYFDLVINDEAHRSIYGDAREVVQFFQATRIGLTATPKAYLKNVNIKQLAEKTQRHWKHVSFGTPITISAASPALRRFATTSLMPSKTLKAHSSASRRFLTFAPTSPPKHSPNPAGRSLSMSRKRISKSRTWRGRYSRLPATA